MSSFFKASCFIFWLTWLFCFSILLGSRRFIANHVITGDLMMPALDLMNIVCVTNIVFAFVGCIFLKCDIHHVCCAGLYMICIAIISPGLSIWGTLMTSKNSMLVQKTLTPENITQMVETHLQKEGTTPRWLYLTEHELKCCGINGPQDYREIYKSLPANLCAKKMYDVPESCCATMPNGNTVKVMSKCAINGNEDWRKQIVTTMTNNDPAIFTIQQKCDKTNKEPFKFDKNKFKNVHSIGCYRNLKNSYETVILFLNVIFIILTICSFLMLFAYGRSFCKSSYITGEKSDYSLDVERVSLLDLPALSAQHIS